MSTDAAHKKGWQIFEVVFGVPYLAGIGLQVAAPVSFPHELLAPLRILAGVALIVSGLTFVVLARRELAQRRQPTGPGRPTSQLVTTGVFSVSRNPLYLGGAGVLAGIALALDLPWPLVLLVPAIIACHYILIAPEERYLAGRFGSEYAGYAASVHRWLGRGRRRG